MDLLLRKVLWTLKGRMSDLTAAEAFQLLTSGVF
jgi:hypothetical protein